MYRYIYICIICVCMCILPGFGFPETPFKSGEVTNEEIEEMIKEAREVGAENGKPPVLWSSKGRYLYNQAILRGPRQPPQSVSSIHVCMYAYMYVCMCIYIYIYMYICMCISIYTYVCMYGPKVGIIHMLGISKHTKKADDLG